MSRLELSKIPSLTFYQDSLTAARRTKPIPQLICKGAPCSLYQPEVVRCVSLPGGYGTDVDWKCEADLPDSLRFGRVEVSCEGWSKAGDPYVLKGSCSLEYRLVHVPGTLRKDNDDSPLSKLRDYDLFSVLFSILWIGFLFIILYSFFASCFRRNRQPVSGASNSQRPGPSSGWFPGGMGDDRDYHPPPPPYSKNPPGENQGWRPGFWTGAAMGGLLNHLYNRRQTRQTPPYQPGPTTYDWERPRPQSSFFSGFNRRPSSTYTQPDDRGEGSSNLGSMRRSTGFGGSNVR